MKVIYKLKPNMKKEIKEKMKFKDLAEEVGVSRCYISSVVNGRKKNISKSLAYCICKAISPDYEISDMFNIIEE